MAKITAYGATEIARFRSDAGWYLLRSDGAVLRKSTVQGDGWTRTRLTAADFERLRHLAGAAPDSTASGNDPVHRMAKGLTPTGYDTGC